jgi:hypothetical protein
MADRFGAVAQEGPERASHSHTFPGGRSADLLGQAVDLGLDAAFEPNQLSVTVVVKNLAAHRLPDG